MSTIPEQDPSILLEDISPNGSLLAVVEDDGRTVYLHLVGAEASDVRTRSLWVCNRTAAPPTLDPDWESAGRAPLLPFDACTHPAGLGALPVDSLRVVWFPSGDGAALVQGEAVLAVLPPWAGPPGEGCPGYAAACSRETAVAWPLGAVVRENPVLQRVLDSEDFWRSWREDDPWPDYQRRMLAAVETALGAKHTHYYSLDGGKWPPRCLVQVPTTQAVVVATGGMGIRPQPLVERRVELALALDPALAGGDLRPLLSTLSKVAAFPWRHCAWLAGGHSVPARGVPVGPSGQRFDAFLFDAAPPGAPALAPPPYREDSIETLWLIPITAAERALALDECSDALFDRLRAAGVGWIHGDRSCMMNS